MLEIKKMENFYGIRSLNMGNQAEFSKVNLVFAPNGTFKTSFYSGMENIQKGTPSEIRDRISGDAASWEIKFQDREITANDILTFNTEIIRNCNDLSFFNVTVNESIKDKYNEIKAFMLDVRSVGFKEEMFRGSNNLFENMEGAYHTLREDSNYQNFSDLYSKLKERKATKNIPYATIKESGVLDRSVRENFMKLIAIREQNYELIKRGFGLEDIEGSLPFIKKLFDVGHAIQLKDNNDNLLLLNSYDDFLKKYNDEKKLVQENILSGDEYTSGLAKTLDNNPKQRKFKNFIEEDIRNLDLFAYPDLFFIVHDSTDILNKYNYEELQIKYTDVIEFEQLYKTEYFEESVNKFNERFVNYIELSIDNQYDNNLCINVPKINVLFYGESVTNEQVSEVVSRGEKSALALFILMHQVEKRNEDTLLIIDDESEVFDYTFKHSFIEYINEIAAKENFHIVILSHNFDLLRSLRRRIYVDPKENMKYFSAYKSDDRIVEINKISKKTELELKDKFKKINESNLITYVATKRNIEEYEQQDDNFAFLTQFLHVKENTRNLKIRDLRNFVESEQGDRQCNRWNISTTKDDMIYTEFLKESCDKICREKHGEYNLFLDAKLTLAVGCRILFEEMFLKEDDNFPSNQTRKIYDRNLDDEEKKAFAGINVLIPDFIHLNAFAYEPLMDIKIDRLIDLYEALGEYAKQIQDR